LEDVTWYGWAYDADEHFWASGDTRVPIDSVDGIMPGYEYSLMDVRFDPDGLREMGAVGLPDGNEMQAEASAESSEIRKPVAAADLERWAQVALGVHGESLTEGLALRSARAMFPDHAVSRDRVRALLPARKPGRPVTRGKIGE
jgi:hypothetical protein